MNGEDDDKKVFWRSQNPRFTCKVEQKHRSNKGFHLGATFSYVLTEPTSYFYHFLEIGKEQVGLTVLA